MAFGEKLPKNPRQNYKEAHWGIPSKKEWHVPDPEVPDVLVEMGKLLEIHLEDGTKIYFGSGCHLAYSTTQDTRLYTVLTKAAKKRLVKEFFDPREGVDHLGRVAKFTGGRQARYHHADVLVQNIGLMTDVMYRCEKGSYLPGEEPDGDSRYIHKFGELTEGGGLLPMVCVDQLGRLWFAGGSYKVLRGGITG